MKTLQERAAQDAEEKYDAFAPSVKEGDAYADREAFIAGYLAGAQENNFEILDRMMAAHAQQTACEFAEWIKDENYFLYGNGNKSGGYLERWSKDLTITNYTTASLYKLFLTNKTKEG